MIAGVRIVSTTGPLISLEKMSHGHDLIRRLYDKIVVPPVVLDEIASGLCDDTKTYLAHYGITDLIEVCEVSLRQAVPEAERLHEGEIQAIQLALELKLPLLIEETVGRRVARGLGIHISGIAGQIVKAFRQGIISAAEACDKLSELLQAGRINRKIYEALIAAILEKPDR